MTSSPVADASSRAVLARGGSGPTRVERRARPSRWRRASEVVLVTGTVLAVAAAFGPPPMLRVGLAVAVAAALAACVFAWRELYAAERRHARSTLLASQRHGRQLREERERNASVVGALTGRLQEALATVRGQRVVIAGLRHEIFTLEGDRSQLRQEVQQRDQTIATLHGTVGELDRTVREQDRALRRLAELRQQEESGPSATEAEAQVRHMPRRVRTELDVAAPESESLDSRTLDTAGIDWGRQVARAVLPNYEEDRRRA